MQSVQERFAQHNTLFPLLPSSPLLSILLSFFKTNNYIFHTHTQNHIPSQSLLILRIHLTRLCEFSFEFGEIFFAFFGVEVDDEGIDHFVLSLLFLGAVSGWEKGERRKVSFAVVLLLAEEVVVVGKMVRR